MSTETSIRPEDVLPVRSRVNWGPIFAGAMAALAVYFLLTLLGSAIGFSIGEEVRAGTLATGAAAWAILATVLSLFFGGWIVSRLTIGETKTEAVLYGVILWGIVFAMLLWLLGSGIKTGFNAMVGVASASQVMAADSSGHVDWQDAARRAGIPQERITEWQQQVKDLPAKVHQAIGGADHTATAARASWWAFAGTLLSMLAAIGGAVYGAGPRFHRFLGMGMERITLRETRVAHR